MGRIDCTIDDELDKKFRIKIAQTLGGKKGDLTIALEQAIKEWVK